MLVRQTYKYVKDLSTIFYKYSNYDKTVFFKSTQKSKIFLYPHHRLAWIVIVSSSNEARLQGI